VGDWNFDLLDDLESIGINVEDLPCISHFFGCGSMEDGYCVNIEDEKALLKSYWYILDKYKSF
jgi:hypothetical protein